MVFKKVHMTGIELNCCNQRGKPNMSYGLVNFLGLFSFDFSPTIGVEML